MKNLWQNSKKIDILYVKANVRQVKKLIPDELHLFVREIKTKISSIESRLSDKAEKKSKEVITELQRQVVELKKEISFIDFEYCTMSSPLGEAVISQKLVLPEHQGGTHDVVIFFQSS